MQQIYSQVCIALPKDVRDHLVEVFCLTRTDVTEIIDQTVKSDGYSNDDLKRISLENMCQYIGSEETFMRAWELTLAKVHSELHPPVGTIGGKIGLPVEQTIDSPSEVVINPVAEPENSEKDKVEAETVKETLEEEIKFTEKPLWCNLCGSKGVRHKLGCPRIIS